MRIEFMQNHGGWGEIAIPDGVELRFSSSSGEHTDVSMSPLELIETYVRVRDHGECDMIVGTTRRIAVTPLEESVVRIDVRGTESPREAECDIREVKCEFSDALAACFEALDRISTPEEREEALKYAQGRLDEEGLNVDVGGLYSDLTE
jgi:hypothetical protein